jgi:hypothetical protein
MEPSLKKNMHETNFFTSLKTRLSIHTNDPNAVRVKVFKPVCGDDRRVTTKKNYDDNNDDKIQNGCR